MLNKKSRRLKMNLLKFKRKSVDVAKFVKDLYVENGMAYISCNAEKYNDIINKHSVEGYEWPNGHFIEFINDNAQFVPTEYPIILEICGCDFSEKQQECIEATLSDYYALQLGNAQLALQRNTRESIVLFILGLLAILGIIFGIQGTLGSVWEIFLVLLWFFIWEFLDTFVFERSEYLEKKLEAAQMASMKVTFKKKFVDNPVKPEEEEQILQEIFEEEEIVPSSEWE